MAFTDEALKAKLSTLNETQDSIVSVSQWIMFHKRHADRIANSWLTRLRDSPPPKRLNFIYLVNDIVQNARARKRTEFPDAFAPLMAEAIQTAYRSSPPEIQTRIRRVAEVWRTRNVFETPILEAIEGRLDEIDKSKGSGGKKTLMGNSLFTSSSSAGIPKELETLAPLQITVTKETITARPAVATAQTEYAKVNDHSAVLPSPPVHAARLSSLIKALAAAESSVSASIKARRALIIDLERILEINKAALAKDEETISELEGRKVNTEAKKREVEDAIIRGLYSSETPMETSSGMGGRPVISPIFDGGNGGETGGFLSERPEIEELTPEPDFGNDHDFYQPAPVPTMSPSSGAQANNPAVAAALASFSGAGAAAAAASGGVTSGGHSPTSYDMYGEATTANSPGLTRIRPASASQGGLNGLNGLSAKRRKTSHDGGELVPDLGEMGMEGFGQPSDGSAVGGAYVLERKPHDILGDLDADVDELLRQEGGGARI